MFVSNSRCSNETTYFLLELVRYWKRTANITCEFLFIGSSADGLRAEFEKLGVSGADTAGIMDYFVKVAGMAQDKVAGTTRELLLMGKSIGITAAEISKKFIAALPTLAVYGAKATEIFGKLSAAAQEAKIEVSDLLGVAAKFDTFASAAETAGKLNAILGSQMSATSMLQMTEEQRVETLIMNVQASGMAFKDMDRFTQKAIAALHEEFKLNNLK